MQVPHWQLRPRFFSDLMEKAEPEPEVFRMNCLVSQAEFRKIYGGKHQQDRRVIRYNPIGITMSQRMYHLRLRTYTRTSNLQRRQIPDVKLNTQLVKLTYYRPQINNR